MRVKEEILVESKVSVDGEQRVKREPASEYRGIALVMPTWYSGANVASENVSDESTERKKMER